MDGKKFEMIKTIVSIIYKNQIEIMLSPLSLRQLLKQ
jgi:hypothetical protein